MGWGTCATLPCWHAWKLGQGGLPTRSDLSLPGRDTTRAHAVHGGQELAPVVLAMHYELVVLDRERLDLRESRRRTTWAMARGVATHDGGNT